MLSRSEHNDWMPRRPSALLAASVISLATACGADRDQPSIASATTTTPPSTEVTTMSDERTDPTRIRYGPGEERFGDLYVPGGAGPH